MEDFNQREKGLNTDLEELLSPNIDWKHSDPLTGLLACGQRCTENCFTIIMAPNPSLPESVTQTVKTIQCMYLNKKTEFHVLEFK